SRRSSRIVVGYPGDGPTVLTTPVIKLQCSTVRLSGDKVKVARCDIISSHDQSRIFTWYSACPYFDCIVGGLGFDGYFHLKLSGITSFIIESSFTISITCSVAINYGRHMAPIRNFNFPAYRDPRKIIVVSSIHL